MFDVLSVIFRYIFIVLIYLFMLAIIRMIYLDIRNLRAVPADSSAYLKLINRKESIPYKIKDEYPITGELTIGRVGRNEIILKDPYVSKKHARIFSKGNSYFIEDLNSSNGTFVNNREVVEGTQIIHGDRIKIGQIEFLFVNEN
ncbi:MAG: FHA domain-containing protein [Andreesenia angusta]|nr:FHA domain-containing protein [Andreesenia angusta]